MNYADPELLRQLSAEYVLGTLRGRARRRFETLLQTRPDARAEVGFWEYRLSEFGQDLAPVAPHADVRAHLLRRAAQLGPAPAAASTTADVARARPMAHRRRRRGRGRLAAMAAGAAALLAAFLIGQQHPSAPMLTANLDAPLSAQPPTTTAATPPVTRTPVTAVATPDAPEGGPEHYLAHLKLPASQMGWLLSVSRDHRKLSVVAADDYYNHSRHTFQLWWISPTQGPVPLAALPAERDATTVIDIPHHVMGETQVVFAISLEPQDGPRTGKPSGPVLSTSPQLDQI